MILSTVIAIWVVVFWAISAYYMVGIVKAFMNYLINKETGK
jgi:hypothetical protein|tara:strand:+ start:756 stop:878 length:123 start_codon:yes stop_codon:yes gene_type:complete